MMQNIVKRFFASEKEYSAAGLFSASHFILLVLTVYAIYFALNRTLTLPYSQIRSIIRRITIVLWILEICKIIFKLNVENSGSNYDTWVPLYFCSIAMYAGILSGFAAGLLQRMGDVFLAVGGLIAGICFLLYPSSSLMIYPGFHFLSVHSFLYHGAMTYLGILINRSGLIELEWSDFILYALYSGFFLMLAWIINKKKGSNLMFISRPFAGSFLEPSYQILGKFFTPVMILGQMIIPFLVIMIFLYNTDLLTRPGWYPYQE